MHTRQIAPANAICPSAQRPNSPKDVWSVHTRDGAQAPSPVNDRNHTRGRVCSILPNSAQCVHRGQIAPVDDTGLRSMESGKNRNPKHDFSRVHTRQIAPNPARDSPESRTLPSAQVRAHKHVERESSTARTRVHSDSIFKERNCVAATTHDMPGNSSLTYR